MTQNKRRTLLDVEEEEIAVTLAFVPEEKTAILFGKENLLGSVVENLLGSLNTWKVIRISDDHDKGTIVRDIKNLNPSVVIVYQNEKSVEIQLLLQLIDECRDLRVITISPDNNSIQVYSKQRVWIRNSEEFLAVMEGHD